MASLFLKIDDINGECQDEKYKNWIELDSFHWGATHPSSAGAGSGSSAGRVSIHPVTAIAKLDKAYPDLMQLVCNGDHKPKGKLYGRKMGKTAVEYLKIEMEEVFCTAADVSGTHDSQVMVTYSFDSNKIKWIYTPQKNDGSADGPVTQGWDLKQNKKI